MTCLDGVDPADFQSGIVDPVDVPPGGSLTPALIIDNGSYFDLVLTAYVEFEVDTTPVNYDAAVEFDFSTSNGTAHAGTHYTARTGVHVVIAAGIGIYTGQIDVIKNSAFTGNKTLTVTISNPVNCTIETASAVLTIKYGKGPSDPPDPPPPTDAADLDKFISWTDKVTVYDQFRTSVTNPHGCLDRNQCTGYSVAALTSSHEALDTGKKTTFDAHELFSASTDGLGNSAPVCSSCATCDQGWDVTYTLKRAKATGARVLGGSRRRQIKDWGQINAPDKKTLLARIKRRIYNDGPVVAALIWYTRGHCNTGSTDWNTLGLSSAPHNILPNPGSTRSCVGHAVVIVGWNNNIAGTGIGGFQIQQSGGWGWANSGRAWLPYSYITMSQTHSGTSSPWFRFYWASIKAGG